MLRVPAILHLSRVKRKAQVDCFAESIGHSSTGGAGDVGAAGGCFIALRGLQAGSLSHVFFICLFSILFLLCHFIVFIFLAVKLLDARPRWARVQQPGR